MELIVEDEKLKGMKSKDKIYHLKSKNTTTINYRFRLPLEIFRILYPSGWSVGLKIYFYKVNDDIYFSSEKKEGRIEFNLLNQGTLKNIKPMIYINKNMAKLESDYKNKSFVTYILDNNGFKLFFS